MSSDVPLTLENLAYILNSTFQGGDPRQAETILQQLEHRPGYHSLLLQLVTVNQLSQPVRQSAAVRLKNLVTEYWTIREGEINRFSDNDRQVIKDNLLETIIFQLDDMQIKAPLLATMQAIVRRDYPEQWASLSPAIGANLASSEIFRVQGAMQALTRIFKKYEVKVGAEREKFCALLESLLPVLVQLFQTHVQQETLASYDILRCICKCFFKSNQLDIPMPLRSIQVIGPWMNALLFVMEKEIKADLLPKLDANSAVQRRAAMTSHPLWRAKKWCTKSFNRVFYTFGRPAHVSEANVGFARDFYTAFSDKLLACFMNCLKHRHEGKFVSDRVIRAAYIFLNSAHEHSSLFILMKPHLNFLIMGCVLPVLCLSNEDLETWRDDPHEYIRLISDPYEEFLDHRLMAQNFLISLLKLRTSYTLEPLMAALNEMFEAYAKAAPKDRNYQLKDGGMCMFGTIRDVLLLPKYLPWTRNLLQQHVFPELTSSFGYMRARACWTLGRFAAVAWNDPLIWVGIVQSLMHCMMDPELPIAVQACETISRVIRNDAAAEFLKPVLPKVLDRFFELMDELGSEMVVKTLKRLIQRFEDIITPFSINLMGRLVKTFLGLVQVDDFEGNEESYLASMQCMQTIQAVLWAARGVPQVYPELERHLEPVLRLLLTEDGLEFFESVLEIISCLSYFPNEISPMTWSLLPEIFKAFTLFAADFHGVISSCLDNFLMKGVDVIVNTKSPPLMQCYLAFIQNLLTKDSKNEDAVVACNGAFLLSSLFLHGKGKIDHLYPDLLSMLIGRLSSIPEKQKLNLKLMSFMALGSACYASPQLFIHIICTKMSENHAKSFFNVWISHHTKFKRAMKYLKVGILAFTSIFAVPLNQLPPYLQQGLPNIIDVIMALLADYRDKQDALEDDQEEGLDEALRDGADEDEDEEEEGDEEDEKEQNGGNVEDIDATGEIDDLEEGAYDSDGDTVELRDLPETKDAFERNEEDAKETEEQINRILSPLDEDEPKAGDVDEVDPESYESPIDDVEPFVFFAQAMQMVAANETAFWQHLQTKQWKKKDKKRFKDIVDEANQRQLTLAKEKKEKEERNLKQQQKSMETARQWALMAAQQSSAAAPSSSSSSSH